METKKSILIVTDGVEGVQKIAEGIAAELRGNHVVLLPASGLGGTDVLAADIYFFGCQEPHPVSFAYLEELLLHMNLVGRPCGVFSPGSKTAVQYLASIVHDAELALKAEPFLADGDEYLTQWVRNVVTQKT